ncbi:hypothetical protein FGO68_gene10218 [Halteria grandinella]|uniref:Uncharacterized protein n=1 Tax=Halteria grandinella TaxID=5974 RepID=A0A8J8T1N8_HALGN|nr:hypothetical protein FGO68_gene10218 [Halteria grandinella]
MALVTVGPQFGVMAINGMVTSGDIAKNKLEGAKLARRVAAGEVGALELQNKNIQGFISTLNCVDSCCCCCPCATGCFTPLTKANARRKLNKK